MGLLLGASHTAWSTSGLQPPALSPVAATDIAVHGHDGALMRAGYRQADTSPVNWVTDARAAVRHGGAQRSIPITWRTPCQSPAGPAVSARTARLPITLGGRPTCGSASPPAARGRRRASGDRREPMRGRLATFAPAAPAAPNQWKESRGRNDVLTVHARPQTTCPAPAAPAPGRVPDRADATDAVVLLRPRPRMALPTGQRRKPGSGG